MRASYPSKLEVGRIVEPGPWSSRPGESCGAFRVHGPCGATLMIIAGDGDGWEHVSVSTRKRPPNWQEMCFVKDLFWNEHECVVQYHPAKADYVNMHPYTLHMWCSTTAEFPKPPSWMVGVKDIANPTEEERRALNDAGFGIVGFRASEE